MDTYNLFIEIIRWIDVIFFVGCVWVYGYIATSNLKRRRKLIQEERELRRMISKLENECMQKIFYEREN